MSDKPVPVFIMVPRKLLITWVVVSAILFGGILYSFQYTNYVDRRSNTYWCGVVSIFDDSYKTEPPTNSRGETLAREFDKIRQRFDCT